MPKSKSEYRIQEIKKLQDNLIYIRNAGGWTTEEFGNMLGVTKQTISNLENKKSIMSLTQYIAIRSVLDFKISVTPENELLRLTVEMLIDDSSQYSAELKERFRENVRLLTMARSKGTSDREININLKRIGIIAAGVAGAAAVGTVLDVIGEASKAAGTILFKGTGMDAPRIISAGIVSSWMSKLYDKH